MFAWLRKSRANNPRRLSASGGAAPGYYATQDPWGSQLDEFDRDFDLDYDDASDGGFDAPPAKPKGRKRRWLVRIVAALLFLFIIAVGWLALTAPLSKSLEPIAPPQITLLASDGTPIARSGANVEAPVEVEDLPEHVVGAFLSIEDRRFYSHWGVDPRGLARAAISNATGGPTQGGSTITQQLAKFTFLTPERSLTRKAREMLIAFWLEGWLTKDEILERYLSNAYFGDNQYGLRAASLHYFYRQPENLKPEQAAMLAGLLKAPSRLAPNRNYEGAEARMRLVINAMAEEGYLTAERAAALPSPELDIRTRNTLPTGTYFADWVLPSVRKTAERSYAKQTLTTTLDAGLQRLASQVVSKAALGNAQVALVAMRPNGEVVAMIGGKDYATSPFNRATQAKRQPGSTFKLFTYLAAIEAGMDPGDRIANTPIETGSYRPKNAGGKYSDTISLEEAFAQSSNVATVRLFNQLGSERVIDTAREFGVTADMPVGDPSLALGTTSMSLLELTSAYAGIAANRFPIAPVAFTPEEKGWTEWFFSDEDSLSGNEHDAIERLLRASVNKGTGRAAALTIPNYGKTGTTQNYRDALFVGYAGGLVVGVWVGNDDNSPLDRVTGGGLPARIWRDFMTSAISAEAAPAADAPDPSGPIQPLDVPDNVTIPIDGSDLEVNLREGAVVISGEAEGIPLEIILSEDGISLDEERLEEALERLGAQAERQER
ncbi:transglycosylase domain-containing protein [Erythrobacter sp. HA6-11]